MRVTFASSGAIELLGILTDTQEKIRGTVLAGSTELTISPAGLLDPDQVVAFTPIN
jgi:hypothetical protein